MDAFKELCDFLREAGVRPLFGLRQQGHMPAVERMLKEGATWEEIGKAIGWIGRAAKESYWMETTIEAGARAERERVSNLVYQMTTAADVEPLCDACDRAGIKKHSIPAHFELGWNMALRELRRRLEEPERKEAPSGR